MTRAHQYDVVDMMLLVGLFLLGFALGLYAGKRLSEQLDGRVAVPQLQPQIQQQQPEPRPENAATDWDSVPHI